MTNMGMTSTLDIYTSFFGMSERPFSLVPDLLLHALRPGQTRSRLPARAGSHFTFGPVRTILEQLISPGPDVDYVSRFTRET